MSRDRDEAREVVAKWKADIGQVVKYEQMESDIATALSKARRETWEAAIEAARSAFDQGQYDKQSFHDSTLVKAGAMEQRVVRALEKEAQKDKVI
jgi:hypothetical protein